MAAGARQLARVLREPDHLEARGAMLLGSHLAGLAIEHSMLGAAHACANPLTAEYGVTHGVAVVADAAARRAVERGIGQRALRRSAGRPRYADPQGGDRLAHELEQVAAACGFPRCLADAGVEQDGLPALAEAAAAQWTGGFNPRPVTRESALALYQAAWRR